MSIAITENPMLDGVQREKSNELLNAEIAKKGAKLYAASVENAETLAKRAKDATDAIAYIASHIETSWEDCRENLKSSLAEIREIKFAIDSETKQLLSALGDIRRFFLDDRHEEQVRRLAEFVSLCERLKSLKDSGFLDDVADTILRLESKS